MNKSLAKKRRTTKSTRGNFWELRLYIAGQTPNSIAAIANLKKICEDQLRGKYRIEVIDLLKKPHLAKGDQIVAWAARADGCDDPGLSKKVDPVFGELAREHAKENPPCLTHHFES